MLIHQHVDLGKLTIPEGSTASNSMDFRGWRGSAQTVTIYGPGSADGSLKVQVSENDVDWFDKQSAGSDIAIAADGSVKIEAVDFKYLRVLSDTVETDDRVMVVKGEEGV